MAESLMWGDVDLLPSDAASTALGYMVEASSDGTNWGNPEAIVTEIASKLRDGTLGIVERFGNREAPVYIRVTSPTYAGLNAAEKALTAETRRPGYNTLSWCPAVGVAETSVFDVVWSRLDYDFDDLGEVMLERHFVATLSCLPFPRAAEETVLSAPAPPPSTPVVTVVDSGSSTTGWSGTPNAPTVVSGTVQESETLGPFTNPPAGGATRTTDGQAKLVRNGSISTTTTPYIYVDVKVTATVDTDPGYHSHTLFPLVIQVNGVDTPVMASQLLTNGFTRYYVNATGITVTSISVTQDYRIRYFHWASGNGPGITVTVQVDQVVRTDTPLTSGSRRQLSRSLTVLGDVRTEARLAITHESAALGEVLCYVYRDENQTGYAPPLRPWFTTGSATTTDANLVSGASNMLDTQQVYDVPASALPAGNYRLYAKFTATDNSPVTLRVTTSTRVGGVTVPGSTVTEDVVVSTVGYSIQDLVGLSLPSALLANTAGAVVRITIVDLDTSGTDVTLDEAWLFNMDIGALTHVECGSGAGSAGGSARRLWLDPATISNDGMDAIYIGHSSDRSDAFMPGPLNLKGWTPPTFEPGVMSVFTVTTNTIDAAVELRYFRRYLHNVGVD